MKNVPDLILPKYVRTVIQQLDSSGYSAFLVGGCVRDLFMGRRPSDYDIATSAYPEDVMKLFPSTYPTGMKHGTVTVLKNGHPLEITTFRADGVYSDGRRPDSVTFTPDIFGDLKRRDFTINAMAWSEQNGLIDPYGGRDDLLKKIIRCVGEPADRFHEDALRILRAWRFSAMLGFEIEQNTADAALKLKERLRLVSPERVHAELCKMLLSKHAGALLDLVNKGLLEHFGARNAPETLLRLSKTERDLPSRAAAFAVLLELNNSIEKADTFLFQLRFDKKNGSTFAHCAKHKCFL